MPVNKSAITHRFDTLKSEGRKALVCYITAGYPDFDKSIKLLQGTEQAGADIIEVGVPFSDPMADGPVIQQCSQAALDNGITLDRTLELISAANLKVPVVLFSYLNPVLSYVSRQRWGSPLVAGAAGNGSDTLSSGLQKFREMGCVGLLLSDLPVGADEALETEISGSGLDFIRLVAPTTPIDRIDRINHHGSGFIYLISRLGVTGMHTSLASDLEATIARVRAASTLPVCVGFGVSTPEQAHKVAGLCDGVIVGSAIMKASQEGVDRAVELIAAIRVAIDEGGLS